jgi:ring-1,2-phenylacetyl-CoA epoxidase subunit PaaD
VVDRKEHDVVQRVERQQDLDRIWKTLESIVDPEIPVVSVVEMGMIPDVYFSNGVATVELSPTFAGCPALDMIRDQIRTALVREGFESVDVRPVFDPPWTTDRITEAGLKKLKDFGLAPPDRCGGTGATLAALHQVTCPFCNSRNTTLESVFGPTLCRAIHYCNDCMQSFEQFKPV